MLHRLIKYSLTGLTGVTSINAGFGLYSSNYDINSFTIVRLGRSAVTAIDIAILYKRKLYYKDWDQDSDAYRQQRSIVHKIAASKLLNLICNNKGVYIKVGQHIGGLEYILPPEFVETMKILHSDAPQNSVEDLYKVIKQDLRKNPDELFNYFEPQPLGTASLAQVHKARLKSGEIVAVKVQHYYVQGHSDIDMKTMEFLVHVMSIIFPDFKMQWLVDESKKNIKIELNFLNEAENSEKISEMFRKYNWLKIPKIYRELSTSRVLIQEYMEGVRVTDVKYVKDRNINPLDISNKIGKLYAEMIFVHGFVHSDPHPGNILIKSTSKPGEADIILLDHGLYAILTDKFRYEYSNLWLSLLDANLEGIKKHSSNLGVPESLYPVFACMVSGRPWEYVVSGITKTKIPLSEKELVQSRVANLLPKIADVLAQVDRQMLLLIKTNDLVRSIEATLGTRDRMTAYWVMSKCCVRSSYDELKRRPESNSFLKRLAIELKENFLICKLNLYFLYLGLVNYDLKGAIKIIF